MRLFIAINLPEEVKNKIGEVMKKINLPGDISVRFLSPQNWHLTIVFLGYQADEALNLILKSLQETTENYSNILKNIRIEFEKIIWAPPDKPARMIWLAGAEKTSQTLGELKTKLEDILIKNGVKFKRENRVFNTHITLARFSNPLGKLADSLITPLSLSFETQTLDLMASHLKRTGAEYEVISQFAFKLPVL